MLRVLHCIYDDPKNPWVAGGGAVRVYELYRRLAGSLAEVTVATGNFPGAVDEVIDGIRYHRIGARKPYAWSRATYSFSAGRLLARGNYDVGVFDFSTYTPLRIPLDKPIGVTVHHVTGRTATARWGRTIGGFVASQERKRLQRARFFSATSRVTEARLRTLLGPRAEIRLIHAGVSDHLFELPHREADYLLYFGRLDWFQKGLDILLEAVRLLVQNRPDLRLKVAGRGKDLDRLVERTCVLKIRENVEVIGAVGEAGRNELFSRARLLVMPSRFEGFGMVAAEAMAAGIPVIASDAGSLPEVIDAPAGGELVPSEDPQALAQKIAELLENAGRRRELSRSARQSAERFRWDRIAAQHLDFLEAIHAGASGKTPQET